MTDRSGFHRNATWGVRPRPHTGMYLLQYVTTAANLATSVLAPRTSVTHDEPNLLRGRIGRRQPRQRGVRAACTVPSPLGALRRAGLSTVFRKRRRHARHPHHPGSGRGTVVAGDTADHPHGAGFISVACSEGAPVATVHQATPPQLRTPSLASEISTMCTRFGMCHRPTASRDTKSRHASGH